MVGVCRRLRAVLCLAASASMMASMSAAAQQCTIQNLTPVAFGVYDPTAGVPDDATGSFRVRCSPRSSYSASISAGAAGGFFPRTLVQGTDTLAYNLFREAARVTVWGNGAGGSQVVNVADSGPPGNPVTLTMFGRIPAGQWVAAGPYQDTLVLTIVF